MEEVPDPDLEEDAGGAGQRVVPRRAQWGSSPPPPSHAFAQPRRHPQVGYSPFSAPHCSLSGGGGGATRFVEARGCVALCGSRTVTPPLAVVLQGTITFRRFWTWWRAHPVLCETPADAIRVIRVQRALARLHPRDGGCVDAVPHRTSPSFPTSNSRSHTHLSTLPSHPLRRAEPPDVNGASEARTPGGDTATPYRTAHVARGDRVRGDGPRGADAAVKQQEAKSPLVSHGLGASCVVHLAPLPQEGPLSRLTCACTDASLAPCPGAEAVWRGACRARRCRRREGGVTGPDAAVAAVGAAFRPAVGSWPLLRCLPRRGALGARARTRETPRGKKREQHKHVCACEWRPSAWQQS